MTDGALRLQDIGSFGRRRHPRPSPQGMLCALTLLLGASIGSWLHYGEPNSQEPDPRSGPPQAQGPAAAKLRAERPAASPRALATSLVAVTPPLRRYLTALLDPSLTSGLKPTTFALSAPLRAGFQPVRTPMIVADALTLPVVADALAPAKPPTTLPLPAVPTRDVPLPRPRPGSFLPAYEVATRATALRGAAPQSAKQAVAGNPGVQPSFFERLFGGSRGPSTVLAYAAPEDGAIGGRGLGGVLVDRASPERTTAVYNIATHTVTLPDGTKLEAHSGLGASLDDPRSITQHMRGATPPNVYDLEPRALLFHGVKALRLNPIGGTTYGRLGLLAHTYMLGPRGDSNGCVVFKNYQAFLSAYENGKVTRLAVVAGLS